jgi:hypothetical protein
VILTPPKAGQRWTEGDNRKVGQRDSVSTSAFLPQSPTVQDQAAEYQPYDADEAFYDPEDTFDDEEVPEDYHLTPEELKILGSMSIKPINAMTTEHKRLILSVHGAGWEAAARIVFPEGSFST